VLLLHRRVPLGRRFAARKALSQTSLPVVQHESVFQNQDNDVPQKFVPHRPGWSIKSSPFSQICNPVYAHPLQVRPRQGGLFVQKVTVIMELARVKSRCAASLLLRGTPSNVRLAHALLNPATGLEVVRGEKCVGLRDVAVGTRTRNVTRTRNLAVHHEISSAIPSDVDGLGRVKHFHDSV
jgi:hypothetical protein